MQIPNGINFAEYIQEVGLVEAQEIHNAGYWEKDLIERSHGEKITGDCLPWAKTFPVFRLRPGELTLWGGMNGHRKSMLLGQVMLNLLETHRVAIASLEMKPTETLWRMCLQAAGTGNPPEAFVKRFSDYADRTLLIYDQLDTVKADKILGFVHYCAKVMGCEHIVIDSLTKCGLGTTDRDKEADFIDRLQWAAKSLNCHVHLVCHVRKPNNVGEEYQPTKFDVRGAGQLVDLCDNLIIVWKNKKRESMKGMNLELKNLEYFQSNSDQILKVEKQRHGAWEGNINLYFHDQSLQFTSEENRVKNLDEVMKRNA
jgi:twinkle protein